MKSSRGGMCSQSFLLREIAVVSSVLSATEQGSLHHMQSQFGLSHYFDFVFCIAD